MPLAATAHPDQHHPAEVTVMAATLTAGLFPFETTTSWTGLYRYDVVGRNEQGGCGHVMRGAETFLKSGPRVAESRNRLVEELLTSKVPGVQKCDWLLMIDADMTFTADIVCRLLDTAYAGEPEPQRLVVGGLCFGGSPLGRLFPTIYELVKTEQGVMTKIVEDYAQDSVLQVGATGGACLLIHRSVLMAMAADWPNGFGSVPNTDPPIRNPHPWFVEGINPQMGAQFGEDIAFCMRLNAMGIPVYVDTAVKLGHMKMFEMDEAWYLERRAAEVRAERTIKAKGRKR